MPIDLAGSIDDHTDRRKSHHADLLATAIVHRPRAGSPGGQDGDPPIQRADTPGVGVTTTHPTGDQPA